jgi:hypothetical protein
VRYESHCNNLINIEMYRARKIGLQKICSENGCDILCVGIGDYIMYIFYNNNIDLSK